MMERSPPYRLAVLVSAIVMAGYLATLAPSVTFWDAGELITAGRTLGIPHPPGSPFFVLLSHVWGTVFAVGSFAWRLNVLSALCAALTAGCWFLLVEESARRLFRDLDARSSEVLATGAGVSAALFTAFNFTTWQNATEAEVYSVAMLIVGLSAWLVLRWRAERTSPRAPRLMLLLLFLAGISVGNHLLALLAGPGIVAAMLVAARESPLPGEEGRREFARIFVLGSVWLLTIAAGLGSTALTAIAAAAALGAISLAARRGEWRFGLTAVLVALIGITPYLFLLLRARQGPWLNESDPSTWGALLDVIRRAQYPVRTPLDDPTVLHGPDNPGRTLTILGYQIANFAQYFDWQWARSLGSGVAASLPRLAITLMVAALGLRGAAAQRRADRSGFALILGLFLLTGPILLLYMNFKPGPSLGWDRWPDGADHEVRERDYFFVAAFVTWGLWAALGLTDLVHRLIPRVQVRWRPAMLGVFAFALVPPALNFRAATRRQTPEATFAGDAARAFLQSAPPGAILFTWGDNDTFPLWEVQAVEGVRPDVTIVCLSLAETPWYLRQLRRVPGDEGARATLASAWREVASPHDAHPVVGLTDQLIASLQGMRLEEELRVLLPTGLEVVVPAGSMLNVKDLAVLHILQQNAGRRPISWALTTSHKLFGLGSRLVQTGLVLTLPSVPPDSSRLVGGEASGPGGALLDLPTTVTLIRDTWQFGRLEQEGVGRLDPASRAMAGTMAIPMMQAAVGLLARGDTTGAVSFLERASRLSDSDFPARLMAALGRR